MAATYDPSAEKALLSSFTKRMPTGPLNLLVGFRPPPPTSSARWPSPKKRSLQSSTTTYHCLRDTRERPIPTTPILRTQLRRRIPHHHTDQPTHTYHHYGTSVRAYPACLSVPKHISETAALRIDIPYETTPLTTISRQADSLTEEQVSEFKEAFSLFVSCASPHPSLLQFS